MQIAPTSPVAPSTHGFRHIEILEVTGGDSLTVKGDLTWMLTGDERFWIFAPPSVDAQTGAIRGTYTGSTFQPAKCDSRYLWAQYRYMPPMAGYEVNPGTPGIYGKQPGTNTAGTYHAWNRQYDPGTGRWTTPDPAASPWGNLWDYCMSVPLQSSDPTGLLLISIMGTGQDADTDDTLFNWALMKQHGIWDGTEEAYRFGKQHLSDWKVTNIRDDEDWVSDAHKVASRICKAKHINPNETIKIVGFSRGAALALVIAKFLADCGCCEDKPCWKSNGSSYECDGSNCNNCCKSVEIDFLGLIDPVSSDATGVAPLGVGAALAPFFGPLAPVIGGAIGAACQQDDDSFVPGAITGNVKKHLVIRASGWSKEEKVAMGKHGIKGATEKEIKYPHAGDKGITGTGAAGEVLGALAGAMK